MYQRKVPLGSAIGTARGYEDREGDGPGNEHQEALEDVGDSLRPEDVGQVDPHGGSVRGGELAGKIPGWSSRERR
jgi:hypothetical protein